MNTMRVTLPLCVICVAGVVAVPCRAQTVGLPQGVRAVWDLGKAFHETTVTRERVCINGLWRWQPTEGAGAAVPVGNWGYFKVPGCWPGLQDWLQKDCQTVFAHPDWKERNLGEVAAAWYEREVTIPEGWAGRRISLTAETVNSYAGVYVDGRRVGEVVFPEGEVDLTGACRPGATHVLSLNVLAMPLNSVLMTYNDTSLAREVAGSVARRGLCGDVFLVSEPAGPRLGGVQVETSVRNWEISFRAALRDLAPEAQYRLEARVTDGGRQVAEFTSEAFGAGDLKDGRFAFGGEWHPEKLWDIHTPGNVYEVSVSLRDAGGKVLDSLAPVRFGFRELWIEGRDFILNGTRLWLSVIPLDNAQIGAAWSSYEGAKESLLRQKSMGTNFMYTHNYDCQPGSHLGFAEVLRAADDVGMLVALSQPHFGQYDWEAADAAHTNGYARHAAFYAEVAGNHPSVVAYSMSHNATGYVEAMNPDMIDGVQDPREGWAKESVKRPLAAEAIVKGLDPTRTVYHHSSGNLGAMHTNNFYANFTPTQELCDWFEHWGTVGVKPLFLCEFGSPLSWDFTMYRGWYNGSRTFGSATVPWEMCFAEWNAQFLGDQAYKLSELEKRCLRWEAGRFASGQLWHRWDYPREIGSTDYVEQYPAAAAALCDEWRAFRTWGVSATNAWDYDNFWRLRDGVETGRKALEVDWENLQRPGFSADYLAQRFERRDMAYERDDWEAMPTGEALVRNNGPLLAYIGGKAAGFTEKGSNFLPGQAVEKQLIVINNSRVEVTADCAWSLGLPRALAGSKTVAIGTGQQARVPLQFELPAGLAAGGYEIRAAVKFSSGETQEDSFAIQVLAPPAEPVRVAKVALFDPRGETGKLLASLGVQSDSVGAGADLSGYDLLIIGKGALTAEGAGADLSRVREGLRVIVFEQTAEVMEKRLGFRAWEYGLRNVFARVPDHPALAGVGAANLHDWRGEATLVAPRLDYTLSPTYGRTTPTVEWCGLEVPHIWRCGSRGSVASVLIEKPARGDFLPIVDGGYSLQFSPLMEYREGKGVVIFCQLDVTGRTEGDPAAERIARNLLGYAATWQARPRKQVVYVGEAAGQRHLEAAGIRVRQYDGDIASEEVVVLGPNVEQIAGLTPDIERHVDDGGNVVAVGLGAKEAVTLLPLPVETKQGEHIAAHFEAFGRDSALAGVGPADVHNRAPKEVPLVTGGDAEGVGDGVLATARGGKVVFYQFPPWAVTKGQGRAATFGVDDRDAREGQQSALISLGSVMGSGCQFGQAMKAGGEAGKTYTFAVWVKALEEPVTLHLEIERAGSPWDRALKSADMQAPAGEWTELHATFTPDKAFAEGWQAYVASNQEGARLRVDMMRLYEGDYVAWNAGDAGPTNLLANPGFEAGAARWWFNCGEQYNLRRTFRRSSFTLTRLLANMGAAGETPLLSRFATPLGEGPGETKAGPSVVRNGDFSLDADGDGMGDEWQFQPDSAASACTREQTDAGLALRMERGEGNGSVLLAQHDVPMVEGQWYRIRLKARAEGMGGARVSLTVTDTKSWQYLFDSVDFAPTEQWRDVGFVVQSKGSAESGTRLQIWHGNGGVLWLAGVTMQPVGAPGAGRWLEGLYLDEPVAWDDPYRFFCW